MTEPSMYPQTQALDPAAAPGGVGGLPPVPDVEPEFVDYFSFDDFRTFTFPDGKQWIKFKIMNEGDKAKFQRLTNRDIKVNQKTQDATIRADVAQERHELIKLSVVDWHVVTRDPVSGSIFSVPFSKSDGKFNLEVFLSRANPKLIEDLEFAIRMANPWMQGDMTLEEIDKEISRLRELRDQKERETAGN